MSGSVSEYSFMKRNVPNVQCLSQKQPINFPTYFQEQNIHLEVHLLSIPSYQLKSKEVFFFYIYLFIWPCQVIVVARDQTRAPCTESAES